MPPLEHPARGLTLAFEGLEEPYLHNAVEWLEGCMERPVVSLEHDLRAFLDELHPVVRDSFIHHVGCLLEDALDYFGKERKPRRPMWGATAQARLRFLAH